MQQLQTGGALQQTGPLQQTKAPQQIEVVQQQPRTGLAPVPRQATAVLHRQEPVPRLRTAAIAVIDPPIADHVARRLTGHPVTVVHRVVARVHMVVREVVRGVAADAGARSRRMR